ncbi:MAG: DsrE/DsrF/DrsH-like family protein [Lentihominibacter sp.]
MKTVIIGGVAGGATAAARLRRLDENMEIVMFDRGNYISYANCGLPYHIGNVIQSREALLLQTPEGMKKKYKNVDSLETLMKSAMDNGVKLVACTMSMDVMGIREEELIDGVELAGVASYLGDAEMSNVNLFV